MLGAFGSVAVAEQLDSGEYPLLRPLWGYLNTPIPADQIPALRSEIVRLVKALSRDHAPQEVLDELDDLLVFLRATEQLGLGIHVSGP
jgi:hypothetical protein